MGTVIGDIKLRVGSEDPITIQLLKDDGITPIGDISSITSQKVKLVDISNSSVVKEFSGDKLVISDGPNAKLQILQVSADFTAPATWLYFVEYTDSGKAKRCPEDKEYKLIVRRYF